MQELTATSMIFSPFACIPDVHEFFRTGEKPFPITPDPRYLFMSERHAEALAHLLYGINEAADSSSSPARSARQNHRGALAPRAHAGHADVAVILNPQLTPVEFVMTICEELGSSCRRDASSIKDWSIS